jgi:two-component system, OmpR family, sensor histidine kinase KdpD
MFFAGRRLENSATIAASASVLKPLRLECVLRSKYIGNGLRAAAATGFVLLATWTAYEVHLNLAAACLLQLLVILTVALRAGFWHATLVSVIASCLLDYFFAPSPFTFYIADPQNWLVLAVFEISALVVSRLSTEAHQQARQAKTRQGELEQLYEISQQLLLLERKESVDARILSLIQNIFRVQAAVLFDAFRPRIEMLGADAGCMEPDVRGAYLQDRDSVSLDGQTWFRVLRLGVRPMGAIGLRGEKLTAATVNALASLTAIALERAHSFERESRAEAERQTEQLRTTVLDALAHEYKTPLTAIRTAASGLIEMRELHAPQTELVGLIDLEAKRLNELTTRLLLMSRLDRVDVRIRPQQIQVDELVQALLGTARTLLTRHSFHIEGLDTGAYIRADRELVNMALTQFLDNAGKYSDPDSTITLAVEAFPDTVRVSVQSAGPPIPYEYRERIFERFYRTPGSNHKAAGTGIGLSITKKVAEAHQGRAWVTSEGHGNTFSLEIPRLKAKRI